jgi:hypothetical protein
MVVLMVTMVTVVIWEIPSHLGNWKLYWDDLYTHSGEHHLPIQPFIIVPQEAFINAGVPSQIAPDRSLILFVQVQLPAVGNFLLNNLLYFVPTHPPVRSFSPQFS